MTNDNQPELITVAEFLARYSIGRTSFYREVAAGRLPIRKFGTATRVARADAEAWAASLPIVTGEAA
jgi:predicted DNA-binding transcriptional regulator AlpA